MEPIDPKVRINAILHNRLSRMAKKEGISLKEMTIKIIKAGLKTLL